MARDIGKRLRSLEARRKGTDRIKDLTTDSAIEVLAKSTIAEAYQKRAPTKEHTQYALGSMQAVDADYTRISLEEAGRVGAQLESGLEKKSIRVQLRLQGSVPCDIHIRGVSDVDLLVLDDRYFHYDPKGQNAVNGYYSNPVSYNTLDALIKLRSECENILTSAYPKAKVKVSGPKAINLSEGSLRRPVDVVPANWFNTADYQQTNNEVDRGVHILNKDVPERILNMPFRHIFLISHRDQLSLGGLKKAIRLCKNVKSDASEEGAKINLSSFDIASALWHSDLVALTVGVASELAVLAEATRFLDYLSRNNDYARTLSVPDGSRKIFDTDDKLEALLLLSLEMDDLSEKVAKEQLQLGFLPAPSQQHLFEVLRKAEIPS